MEPDRRPSPLWNWLQRWTTCHSERRVLLCLFQGLLHRQWQISSLYWSGNWTLPWEQHIYPGGQEILKGAWGNALQQLPGWSSLHEQRRCHFCKSEQHLKNCKIQSLWEHVWRVYDIISDLFFTMNGNVDRNLKLITLSVFAPWNRPIAEKTGRCYSLSY